MKVAPLVVDSNPRRPTKEAVDAEVQEAAGGIRSMVSEDPEDEEEGSAGSGDGPRPWRPWQRASTEIPQRNELQEINILRAMKLELPPVYPRAGDTLDLPFAEFKMYLEKLNVYIGRGTSTLGMNSGFRKASSFKLQCRLKDKCRFFLHSREFLPDKQVICACQHHTCSPQQHEAFSIATQGFLCKYLFREEDFPMSITMEGREVQKFISSVSAKFGIDFSARSRREMISRLLHDKLEEGDGDVSISTKSTRSLSPHPPPLEQGKGRNTARKRNLSKTQVFPM